MIAYQLVWFLREDPVEVNLRQEKNLPMTESSLPGDKEDKSCQSESGFEEDEKE